MKIKRMIKKIASITAVVAFTAVVLSLGITYAIGANQLQIDGQAYFLEQAEHPETLPIVPYDPSGTGQYFTPNIPGGTIHIINQYYQDGDFFLEICASNTNNGNTTGNQMSFQMANPTVTTWTSGAVTMQSPWSGSGISNTNNFSFSTPTLAPNNPASLAPGDTATVTMTFGGQLGKADTGGSAAVTISYQTNDGTFPQPKTTHVYFIYWPRNNPSAGCIL